MKRLSFALLFFCLRLTFLFSQKVNAESRLQPAPGFDTAQLDTITRYAAAFPNGTQLAIALIQDDQVYFLGVTRENDTLKNIVNHQSVFEIGSVTKVFTSTLLAQCTREGIVRLEAPVQAYFAFPLKMAEKDSAAVTLKTLANHTSGLPRMSPGLLKMAFSDFKNPYKTYGSADLENDLQTEVALNSKPSEKYLYSNFGAGLLGHILAKQTGKNYADLLQERIFAPLQMTRSCADRADLKSALVPGLGPAGDTVSNWDFDAVKGAGAILSTAEDLSKFVKANFGNDPALQLQREKTFTISEKMDVALGWHILKPANAGPWHWHNGGTGGYASNVAMNTAKKTGVIVLSNVSAFHPKMNDLEKICFKLMKTLE